MCRASLVLAPQVVEVLAFSATEIRAWPPLRGSAALRRAAAAPLVSALAAPAVVVLCAVGAGAG